MNDNETRIIVVKFLAACVRAIVIGIVCVCVTYCYCANQPKVVRLQVEVVGGANAKEAGK